MMLLTGYKNLYYAKNSGYTMVRGIIENNIK